MNATLRIFPKKSSGNQDLTKVHQTNSNSGPHDHQLDTLTTRHQLQLPNRRKILAIYALTLLMYTVDSSYPDPNRRGGGQLPNPNECNSTLTSGTKNIYPYPIDVNDRGHRLRSGSPLQIRVTGYELVIPWSWIRN